MHFSILEIIKLLKEQEARQYERDHYHREDQNLKMVLERERHAAEIDAVRQELQQWEARREALASQQYKDPENEEGIERIIALLKDQMLHQELALVNLKESKSSQNCTIVCSACHTDLNCLYP